MDKRHGEECDLSSRFEIRPGKIKEERAKGFVKFRLSKSRSWAF